MIRISLILSASLICTACQTNVRQAPLPVSADVGPAIIRFEDGSPRPTDLTSMELDRFATGYRNLEPAFGGVLLCAGKAEADLAARRTAYVTARLTQAGVTAVTIGAVDDCQRLDGYDDGAVLLLTRPR
jgi:hypothetical protein